MFEGEFQKPRRGVESVKRRQNRSYLSWFLFSGVLLFNGAAMAQRAPDELLERRGLRRDGKFYVTANEVGARKRLNAIVAVDNKMRAAIADCEAAIEADVTWQTLDNYRISLETLINDRRLKINEAPPGLPETKAWRGIWQGEINDATNELNVVRGNLQIAWKRRVGPREQERRVHVFNTCRDEFLAAGKELEPFVKEANLEYDKLRDDLDIRNALLVLEGRTGAPLDLGPSKQFKTEVSQLIRENQMVSWNPDAYRSSSKKKKKSSGKSATPTKSKSAMPKNAASGGAGEPGGGR
jgi:hypothetical protein